jgi:hypothetical protein
MSLALLRGAAEAPEGRLRNSDRTACGTERENGRKPTAVLHVHGGGSTSAVSGLTGSTTTTWLDQLAVTPDGAGKMSRCVRRVPVAASLEGFCFRVVGAVRGALAALLLSRQDAAAGRRTTRSTRRGAAIDVTLRYRDHANAAVSGRRAALSQARRPKSRRTSSAICDGAGVVVLGQGGCAAKARSSRATSVCRGFESR